ncbi:hypothetical protein [Streptomyces melanogenes]|uniref:hypothetical protein n=1 Tax=Streptomyces melanogenes TaxID=67326 RepID=UPI00167DF15E|nr:hypothetical protein [Streptomyces melanogenes]GGP57730.1 hypothetical protein GCM10010278_38270 [Streptomyces melanogenes]
MFPRQVKRAVARLALLAAVGLPAAACGSSSQPPPEVDWAGGVCAHLADSGAGLAVPTVDKAQPVRAKGQLVTFLTALSERLGSLRADMQKDGAPPVDGGAAAFGTALAHLDRARTSVGDAVATLSKAQVTDQKSLKSALDAAGSSLKAVSAYKGPADDLRADPKLRKAFDGNPDCVAAVAAAGGGQGAGDGS